jgi:hypothetical protein
MVRRRRRGFAPAFIDFDEDDTIDEDFGEAEVRFLNPFNTTYYLGRGRFGDNSRLHRGLMIIREIEEPETVGINFLNLYKHRMRGRRHGRSPLERRR